MVVPIGIGYMFLVDGSTNWLYVVWKMVPFVIRLLLLLLSRGLVPLIDSTWGQTLPNISAQTSINDWLCFM